MRKFLRRLREFFRSLNIFRRRSVKKPKYVDDVPINRVLRSNQSDLINFRVTHDLKVRIIGNRIHFNQTLTEGLSKVSGSAGNVCIGRDNGGLWTWYAYDWIRVAQTMKARHEIGDIPSGTVVAFCVSSHIRGPWRNGNVRTRTVRVTIS